MDRQGIVLSHEQSPGGAYTTPGYYVCDRFGVAQEGPFDTQSAAFAHLEGRASVSFLDEPVVAQLLQPFSPGLQRSLGSLSRKDPMPSPDDLDRSEAQTLRALASASPTSGDANVLLERLETIREAKAARQALASATDYHFDDEPDTAYTSDLRHSAKSDWLADIPIPGEVDPTMMVTAANTFFERTPESVRSRWGEYVRQAHSAAMMACSLADAGPESYRSFMDAAERLHKVAVRRSATDTLQPWSVVLPAIDPQAHGPIGAPDMNAVNPAPGPLGNPLPLPGAAVTNGFGMEDPAALGAAGAPGGDASGTVAEVGFQDSSWEPNPDPAVTGQRQASRRSASDGADVWGRDSFSDQRRLGDDGPIGREDWGWDPDNPEHQAARARWLEDHDDDAWGEDLSSEQHRVDDRNPKDPQERLDQRQEEARIDRERWVSRHDGAAHADDAWGEDLSRERARVDARQPKDPREKGDKTSEELRLDAEENDLKRREHSAAQNGWDRDREAQGFDEDAEQRRVDDESTAHMTPQQRRDHKQEQERLRNEKKNLKSRESSAMFNYPRQSYADYLKAISEGAAVIPPSQYAGMAAAVSPVGISAQRTGARTAARKYSPRAGMSGEPVQPSGAWRATHRYDPIGWDQFDPRPHPDSDEIPAGSEVMDRGWMSPPGPAGMRFVHVEDANGNHQSVFSKSITPLRREERTGARRRHGADYADQRGHDRDWMTADEANAAGPHAYDKADSIGGGWGDNSQKCRTCGGDADDPRHMFRTGARRRHGADYQINYSDPEGQDLGQNFAPGGDVGWAAPLPAEVAQPYGQLTDFPDTGPERFAPPLPYQGSRRTAAKSSEGYEIAPGHFVGKVTDSTPKMLEYGPHRGYVHIHPETGQWLGDVDEDTRRSLPLSKPHYSQEYDDLRQVIGHTASRRTAEVGNYHYIDKRGDKYVIVQKGTGKVLSTHDSKEGAEKAFRGMIYGKYGSAQRLVARGLFLTAADEDERDAQINSAAGPYSGPNQPVYPQVLSPAAWEQRRAGEPSDPEAFSSGVIVDQAGMHDPVSDLGTVPVQGYAVSPERPQGEMWPFTAPPVGSPATGAADVLGVPTPGVVSQSQSGTSYPQPR